MTMLKVGSTVGSDGYTGKVYKLSKTNCVVIGRGNQENTNKPKFIRVLTEHGRVFTLYFSTEGKCIKAVPESFVSIMYSVGSAKVAFCHNQLNESYDWTNFLSDKVREKYLKECRLAKMEADSYRHECEKHGEHSFTSGT